MSSHRLSLTVLCALICIGAAVAGARAIARSDAQRSHLAFRSSSEQIASSLGTAIEHEEDLVVSASAYIAEHPRISPAGFDRWARSVKAFGRYPELQNFGFVELVPAADLGRFEAALKANPVLALEGKSAASQGSLQILPPGPRPYYCFATAGLARSAATYIPAGLDYCALAPGLLPSRSTGNSSYAPFDATQGTTSLGVETPVYRGGLIPSTERARTRAFIGWLGELLTPSVVIDKAIQSYPGVAVDLSYRHGEERATFSAGRRPAHAQTATIDLHNGWSVRTAGAGASAAIFANLNSTLLCLGCVLLTLLLAALFFVLATSRQRALTLVAEKTRELSHQALHDSLTGLPNRALVLDRARRMLTRSRRATGLHTGVLFIDIDGFKQVNDEYGHAAGDQLLQTVATRLTSAVRAQDTVGRLGGDEFVVLAESDGDTDALRAIAGRIIEGLHEPIVLDDGTVVPVTASIGITSGQYDSAEALLREADTALYQAKAEGKDRYAVQQAEPSAEI